MVKLKDYDKYGKVLDATADYEPVYNSTSEFVNDVCDIEIWIAKSDFDNYEEDEIYQTFKRIKDTQEIDKDLLIRLFDDYEYNTEKEW